MNVLGQDGGYAPIAPGPIDFSRRRQRNQYTKKIRKLPAGTKIRIQGLFLNLQDKTIKQSSVVSR
jgi:hypothetical protein